MTGPNPWAEKAHALDRYRWRLLRERHGLCGSALRFAREAVGDWWFGARAKRRLAKSVDPVPCDFVLLQSAPKVIEFHRKDLLISGLRNRGHNLVETALQPRAVLLSKGMLRRPPYSLPTRYFGLAAYAEWLAEHHSPKVMLNDRNGSLYVPFLRLALNARGAKLVHLAHATTVESSRRLGMNDYDHYFLFGRSSLEALQSRKLRFGSSVAVLAGSHMIDGAYDLPAADPSRQTVLILGVGPDKEKEPGYLATYKMLSDWTLEYPEYRVLIKAHPRSAAMFWYGVSRRLHNVEVLDKSYTLAEALREASVVINIMSNAVIEAALARRPVIFANASGERDIFGQEYFFGDSVTSVSSLQAKLDFIKLNYAESVGSSEAFAEYHLANGNRGLEVTLDLLEEVLKEGNCPGVALSARFDK